MAMLLGVIADDLTGATDIAMILVREGMRTVQVVGVPDPATPVPKADAVVVALKSRTLPAAEAVAQSLAACDWLQQAGAQQIFFKYCSTFDSTDKGNIGPVTDALMQRLGCKSTIACPAFPENGRTVYRGYLFVQDGLLSESSLRHHPLTPMTDANLKRVLTPQTQSAVANIYYETVEAGAEAIAKALSATAQPTIHVVDALTESHLRHIGAACRTLSLVTGGSAVALGLPDNFRAAGLLPDQGAAPAFAPPEGLSVVLSGSCSEATRAQVARAQQVMPSFKIDAAAAVAGKAVVQEALSWAAEAWGAEQKPLLFYSSADPDDVAEIQRQHGRLAVGELVESVLGQIAAGLKTMGARRFVVAGGETSGAVINSLAVKAMAIGSAIDPGVPWTLSQEKDAVALALKSGNFGAEDFFLKALRQVGEDL